MEGKEEREDQSWPNSIPSAWRHFQSDIILLCVRWYLRYALSYRDVEELMAERGLLVDHTTIYRWIQRYAPELEKRCRPHLKGCNDSWKVDAMLSPLKIPGRMITSCDLYRLKSDIITQML